MEGNTPLIGRVYSRGVNMEVLRGQSPPSPSLRSTERLPLCHFVPMAAAGRGFSNDLSLWVMQIWAPEWLPTLVCGASDCAAWDVLMGGHRERCTRLGGTGRSLQEAERVAGMCLGPATRQSALTCMSIFASGPSPNIEATCKTTRHAFPHESDTLHSARTQLCGSKFNSMGAGFQQIDQLNSLLPAADPFSAHASPFCFFLRLTDCPPGICGSMARPLRLGGCHGGQSIGGVSLVFLCFVAPSHPVP